MINKVEHTQLSDYDYEIADDQIAKQPLARRTDSRMMVLDSTAATFEDSAFIELDQFLRPNDLLVFNNTRVVPARLYGQKESGGKVELLLERFLGDNRVLALVKASKSPKAGQLLLFDLGAVKVTVVSRQLDLFELQFPSDLDIFQWLEQYGHIPLPPYIDRAANIVDEERYQTVFAAQKGAVAAPTAGLHFDDDTIARLQHNGVSTAFVTLHVGAGTFQPVRTEDLNQHHMHSEFINVSADVCDAVARCKQSGGRVVAVGTTVCRALETAAINGELAPYVGDTDIFIKEGFSFNCIDMLITNFHLPQSTLLVLVSAFAGYQLIKDAYQHALANNYRFFSYGDLMLISR